VGVEKWVELRSGSREVKVEKFFIVFSRHRVLVRTGI
jgi:hypothetical protein